MRNKSFLPVLCERSQLQPCTVVRCGRNDLVDLFPPASVNSQLAQEDSPRVFERVVPVQVRSAAKSL